MKNNKVKKSIATLAFCGMLIGSAATAQTTFAMSDDNVDYATPVTEANTLPSLEPISGENSGDIISPRVSNNKDVTTYSGGKLTSNSWLSAVDKNGLADYQVSANYNRTDHTHIQTKWFATIGAVSTSKTASVTMSFPTSASVSATTTKSTTTAKTAEKYYQNTKSQKDASYRSNLAIQGDWEFVTLTNEASCWGKKVVKKAAINSQVTVTKK